MGLGKGDLNGDVNVLQWANLHGGMQYYLGLSKGDRNGEVTLLMTLKVRFHCITKL